MKIHEQDTISSDIGTGPNQTNFGLPLDAVKAVNADLLLNQLKEVWAQSSLRERGRGAF